MNGKKVGIPRLLRLIAYGSFILAAALIAWAFVSKIHFLEDRYADYIRFLSSLETRIASINNFGIVILVILLMYFIKSALPIYPVSLLCVATAMVFKVPQSLLINCVGLVLLFSTRYVLGQTSGSPAVKQIERIKVLSNVIQSDSRSSPWLLLALRILPGVPINTVSQLYGAMDFPYFRFLGMSVLGSLPRILFAIVIGRNVSNPFTLKFTVPMVVLLILTGAVTLTLSVLWEPLSKRRYKQLEIHGNKIPEKENNDDTDD